MNDREQDWQLLDDWKSRQGWSVITAYHGLVYVRVYQAATHLFFIRDGTAYTRRFEKVYNARRSHGRLARQFVQDIIAKLESEGEATQP